MDTRQDQNSTAGDQGGDSGETGRTARRTGAKAKPVRATQHLQNIIKQRRREVGTELPGRVYKVFSDNPVLFALTFEAAELIPPPRPWRIYLDVTEATREQVDDAWPVVQHFQAHLASEGHAAKRSVGQPTGPSADTLRWVARCEEVGEKRAREEFRQEAAQGGEDWTSAYQRWYRTVRRSYLGNTRNIEP